MITQHIVSFGTEITLTRLPAGRAEGFVWLSFVARGIGSVSWHVRDHVKLTWHDGSRAEIVESEITGNDPLHVFQVTIRDAGYNTITISYVEDDQLISSENVALPVAPAV